MSMNAPRNVSKKTKNYNASPLTQDSNKKRTNAQSREQSCTCGPDTNQSRASVQGRKNDTTAKGHTKIVVKCNCGFPNNLYIRGEGVKGLSWDKGSLMKCTKADEWIWETDTPFQKAQVKVLINDKWYEAGDNHVIDCGNSFMFQPRF